MSDTRRTAVAIIANPPSISSTCSWTMALSVIEAIVR